LIFKLPGNDDNIGNPTLPAIHGGVIGGFMEMAASLHILLIEETVHLPKVIDFSIDFLRPGRHRDTFAQCDVVRKGRSIVNVAVRAWQTHTDEPIATARAHFLLAPPHSQQTSGQKTN
jgi:acyl-coenzyme A thioesterase PaaI-like protein